MVRRFRGRQPTSATTTLRSTDFRRRRRVATVADGAAAAARDDEKRRTFQGKPLERRGLSAVVIVVGVLA